ncbi:MAG: RsmB/NOP family class I SAM-dependent RNA methyltransferase [Verrucomicrobia bacterium]|nr:RsmB/NOP family class I SAM-dependent RNA methyltransferase [Verrucomicrobiota bacterium]MBU6445834.1 RsmB/NOP family class I SAM-dependent RNA methyltransferase [Verrucomicrobiota bacterium]MDE3046739.1 RsmB/NOP family class I SAM-dependent RNA methyltransferase [Verrucomicrobiota bacterium]
MRLPFCDHHISAILDHLGEKPLDGFLSRYFREHKSIGAHDRRLIGETLYQMVRWKSLIDHFCPSPSPLRRLAAFRALSLEACAQDASIPEPARLGIPPFLWDRFCQIFGVEKARQLCRTLNLSAPTTIRVNALKTTPELLLEKWKGKFECFRCKEASMGIQFKKREPLFALPEFKEGFFEVQDEGSQLVAELVDAGPGDQVLDYCAGSGGKTLSFAPKMKGKGQIYLYDKRPWILQEARKRLKRAGVQNGQFVLPKTPVDWLLVDVPCSGTGTLRRNPDAKWKIDAALVDRLIVQQREIVQESFKFLKPGGKLVYATCSILPEENESQIAYLLAHYPLTLEKQLSFLPEENGKDGFFAAVLKRDDLIG